MRITHLDERGGEGPSLIYKRTAQEATFEHDERGHKTFIVYTSETQDGERIQVTLNRADIVQLYADMNNPDN